MTGAPAKDAALMSVSIVAGPAVTAVLNAHGVSETGHRTGLLTSSKAEASKQLRVFHLPPGSDPNQIISQIEGIAGQHVVDHLIVECESDRPPMAYASLFAGGDLSNTLNKVSRLTTIAFAIHPAAFLSAMLGRGTSSLPACFVSEQMEFVSHIFLDSVTGDSDLDLARSMALVLNPRAEVSPLSQPAVKMWRDVTSISFDFDSALNGAGWRRLIESKQPSFNTDKKITAFGYRARRPFHPERFWNLLQHNWRDVFRAKGFFWLATRMDEVGGLNLAGSELHCASAGAWWASRDESSRESEMSERTRAEWQEPFGDRRQSFAVMAFDVEGATLQSALDACLLTDAELAEGPGSWKEFADPFPSWSAHAHAHHHEDECDHDHDSEERNCCHH
jgi:G3E family GTPase